MRFRFWHTYTNARDKNYGASVTDGNGVHVRGWDAGVTVTPRVRGGYDNAAGTEHIDADEFDVYMTWGSNGGDRSVFLGTVRDTTDGPMWIAEGDLPAIYTRTDAPARMRKHRIRRVRQVTPADVAAVVRTDPQGSRLTEPEPAESDTTPTSDAMLPAADATVGRIDDTLAIYQTWHRPHP